MVMVAGITKIEINIRIKKRLVRIVIRTAPVVIIVRRIVWRIIVPIGVIIAAVWVAVGISHATAAEQ